MSQSRLDEQNIWTVLDKLLLSVNNSRKGGRQKIVFKYYRNIQILGNNVMYIHTLYAHIIYIRFF